MARTWIATIRKFKSMSASERICLIGWGAIGTRVADLLTKGGSDAKIVAIAVRDATQPRDNLPDGAAVIESPDELAATGATLVVEAAGRATVAPWARTALGQGSDFAVSSTSAFVDDALLSELAGIAKANNAKLLIPPGALGGIDALAAASRLPLTKVEHRIVKPAQAWAGIAAAKLIDLDALSEATVFFSDTARATADAFPQNANVAIITALAGMGLDRTTISLVADPTAQVNMHEIHAKGDFGTMSLRFENTPLATNPKSSEMTALSLVRLIENRVSPLVI